MQKTAPRFSNSGSPVGSSISVDELEMQLQNWLEEGQIRYWSKRTLDDRKQNTGKLLWFLRERGFTSCGVRELRAFLAYLTTSHEQPGGRWGSGARQPLSPGRVHKYYGDLRTLFRFIVAEGGLETSPMELLRPPVRRADQVQPFTLEEVDALIAAACRSRHPRRNEAIVKFLLDTGCRASELCSLKVGDVDWQARRCTVLGKGNKSRLLLFGGVTKKALWRYLQEDPRNPDQPLFAADRGTRAGDALTRSGLLQLIERLGKAAKLENCRCHPHKFRHTMAVTFLRNGGNVFTLKELLGHTTLAMTSNYVALAQADLENQHRQFSPVDSLGRR